jgi:phenylalanyl-tRNA synthetase beta subunit
MIVSYKWLQTYFEDQLPEAEKLEELLTLGAFEVENIEKIKEDYILDIDVLPNRAHDCLSHRGIARELSVLLKLKIKEQKLKLQVKNRKLEKELQIDVKDPDLCRRYVGRRIEGVKVGTTPEWLRERIESIGQKSINNIVDVTNYVMFDIGQPLHAFDADKVNGSIVVRKAKKGERITTLDDKEVELDETILIIADEKDPLAIAGIKGGKKAEVDENTVNIILEAANFAPVPVRKTSHRLNILTDSSKRFENEITPEMAGVGMEEASSLIIDVAGNDKTKIGEIFDEYPKIVNPYKLGVSLDEINKILGVKITNSEVENIFDRFGFEYEEVIPTEKVLDLSSQFIGVPYKFGASVSYDAPKEFDCSSFTAYLYAQAGVSIPRVSVDQFVFGEEVKEAEMHPGDVVFSNTGNGKIHYETVEFMKGRKVSEGIDHCGLYIGDGDIIHASNGVEKEKLNKSSKFKNIIGVRRMAIENEKRFVVTIPTRRLDLRIKEDLIEEIGRIYGYSNIEPQALEKSVDAPVNKSFYYVNKVRNILLQEGFSEVYTSVFIDNGEVELENPMTEDKKFLRSNLYENIKKSVDFNEKNKDLLGIEKVKIFEIGKVFKHKKEHLSLCIAVGYAKSKKGENVNNDVKEILEILSDALKFKVGGEIATGVIEIDFNELADKLPEPKSYEDTFKTYIGDVRYKTISPYPFVVRDIAVFVPESVEEEEIKKIIRTEAGELLVRGPKLFDKFEKKDKETGKIEKVSYAFRLVFQSQEKTLTDEEVNEFMDKITNALNSKEGWHVR